MSASTKPEVWLRGPITGIPALLQPAAHALVQAKEDVYKYTLDFPEELLWKKPAGRASVAFHLQHLTGVLDRMLAYARGNSLSEAQFNYLKKEGKPEAETDVISLVAAFEAKIAEALAFLGSTSVATLTENRTVGRKKLPSTVIGLLFHAAEHSQRHVGQLLVTVSILKDKQ